MNMTCENLGARAITEIPANRITRRNLLAGVGAVLAGIGLVGPSEIALAAAKTYTVGKTTDIKVGSSKSYLVAGVSLLITQPKKGVFKAFNGYCTHQQVPLAGIQGSNLVCNQHGASFNTTSGKVTGGPARSPLAAYKVAVSAGNLKVTL